MWVYSYTEIPRAGFPLARDVTERMPQVRAAPSANMPPTPPCEDNTPVTWLRACTISEVGGRRTRAMRSSCMGSPQISPTIRSRRSPRGSARCRRRREALRGHRLRRPILGAESAPPSIPPRWPTGLRLSPCFPGTTASRFGSPPIGARRWVRNRARRRWWRWHARLGRSAAARRRFCHRP